MKPVQLQFEKFEFFVTLLKTKTLLLEKSSAWLFYMCLCFTCSINLKHKKDLLVTKFVFFFSKKETPVIM